MRVDLMVSQSDWDETTMVETVMPVANEEIAPDQCVEGNAPVR
jgi:hypothetical protein